MLLAFEKAELAHTEEERKALLTFAIVGGGPTGVEMAGAIATIARKSLKPDFRHINAGDARVVLLEAGPRILPALPEKLSDYAARALARMGVEVQTSTAVTGCDEKGVDTTNGRIDAATIIWAAGVVASPAAKWLGVQADKAGRIEVNNDLSDRLPKYFCDWRHCGGSQGERRSLRRALLGGQTDGAICRAKDCGGAKGEGYRSFPVQT